MMSKTEKERLRAELVDFFVGSPGDVKFEDLTEAYFRDALESSNKRAAAKSKNSKKESPPDAPKK